MEVYLIGDKLIRVIEENPQARAIDILKEIKQKGLDLTPEWRRSENPFGEPCDATYCTSHRCHNSKTWSEGYSQCLRDIIKELEVSHDDTE